MEESVIVEKGEEGERKMSVVDGFVLEENKISYPNQRPSFVPEDFGKIKHSKSEGEAVVSDELKACESCGVQKPATEFITPSRRFCSVSCCKRYSAERRYHPQGKLSKQKGNSVSKEQLTLRQRMAAYTPSGTHPSPTMVSSPPQVPLSPASTGKGKRKRASANVDASVIKKNRGQSPSEALYVHPLGMSLGLWSQEDVNLFLKDLGYEAYQEKFQNHMVDGRALLLINEDHMIKYLGLMLGPALKIRAHLDAIKQAERQT